MRRLLWMVMCCLIPLGLGAKNNDDTKETRKERPSWSELEKEKRNFLVEFIELTEEEQKDFWTWYDALCEERWSIHTKFRKMIKEIEAKKKDRTIEEADFKRLNDLNIELNIERQQTEKNYYLKLEKILSPQKISRFYEAENRFKERILKRIEKKAEDRALKEGAMKKTERKEGESSRSEKTPR